MSLKATAHRLVCFIGLISMLTACAPIATLPSDATPIQSWAQHQRQLQQLTTWQAKGVVGAKTKQEANSAYVTWQQRGSHLELTFSGPLGAGAARLQGKPGNVTLTTADGNTYHAADPNQLAAQLLGWHLPVNGLQYWVLGLPAPGASHQQQLSSAQLLKQLRQQGWRIDYQRYQRVGQYILPYKLTLTRDGLQLRILIKQWIL